METTVEKKKRIFSGIQPSGASRRAAAHDHHIMHPYFLLTWYSMDEIRRKYPY